MPHSSAHSKASKNSNSAAAHLLLIYHNITFPTLVSRSSATQFAPFSFFLYFFLCFLRWVFLLKSCGSASLQPLEGQWAACPSLMATEQSGSRRQRLFILMSLCLVIIFLCIISIQLYIYIYYNCKNIYHIYLHDLAILIECSSMRNQFGAI